MSYALTKAAFLVKCDTGYEKMVLVTLAWLAGSDRRVAASTAVIANLACCDEKSVSKWLKVLHEKAIISSRRQGRGRCFTINLPLPEGFSEFDDHGRAACTYCGGSGLAMEIDHVIPRSRGGSNHPNNLVVACIGCNSEKGDQLVDEWNA